MERAVSRAVNGHTKQKEVCEYLADKDANIRMMLNALESGQYVHMLRYTEMVKTNSNGKVRKILRPDVITRIYQHLMLLILEPLYTKKDPRIARNCKKNFGITAKGNDYKNRWKKRNIIGAMKHLYYDRRELNFGAYADQRQSYDHCTVTAYRQGLKRLTDDKWVIDFAVNVTYVNGRLPVGTPASPFAHHVIMLDFDIMLVQSVPFALRYADDVFIATSTKEEAHAMMWRIHNWWWYRYGMRAKKTIRVFPLTEPFDFCGYVFHRLPTTVHNKGYTTVRKATVKRAKRARNIRSWSSYHGMLIQGDSYRLITKIEEKMKLKDITTKIKIDRPLDALHIEIKELEGKVFNLIDYDVRYDKNRQPNWVKCLVGIPTDNGKVEAREFHGNYQGVLQFLLAVEQVYGKSFLPMEDCTITNQCGYIFTNSSNQLKYIENEQ